MTGSNLPAGVVYVQRLDGNGEDPADLGKCRRYPMVNPEVSPDNILLCYYLAPDGRWIRHRGEHQDWDMGTVWGEWYSEAEPPEVVHDFGFYRRSERLPPELESYSKYLDAQEYSLWMMYQSDPDDWPASWFDDTDPDAPDHRVGTCSKCKARVFVQASRCWSCRAQVRLPLDSEATVRARRPPFGPRRVRVHLFGGGTGHFTADPARAIQADPRPSFIDNGYVLPNFLNILCYECLYVSKTDRYVLEYRYSLAEGSAPEDAMYLPEDRFEETTKPTARDWITNNFPEYWREPIPPALRSLIADLDLDGTELPPPNVTAAEATSPRPGEAPVGTEPGRSPANTTRSPNLAASPGTLDPESLVRRYLAQHPGDTSTQVAKALKAAWLEADDKKVRNTEAWKRHRREGRKGGSRQRKSVKEAPLSAESLDSLLDNCKSREPDPADLAALIEEQLSDPDALRSEIPPDPLPESVAKLFKGIPRDRTRRAD